MPKIKRSSERISPELIPIYPAVEDEVMDGAVSQYYKEKEPRSHKLARTVGAVAAFTTLYTAQFIGTDIVRGIEEGKMAVQDDHIEVHEIYDNVEVNPLYTHHATFVLTGLGTKNPSETAEVLSAHREVGSVYAIEYSNRDLNTTDMAKQIIKQAKAEGISELSFDGYSAGGAIALDIAAYIHEHEPELHIVSVVLNSSPIGESSLTRRSEDGIRIMNKLLSIHPDFAYYLHGHIATEVLARSNRYLETLDHTNESGFTIYGIDTFAINGTKYRIDYEQLKHEIHSVENKLENPNAASAKLIKSQSDFITYTDYESNLRTLSMMRPNDIVQPIIFYTRSLARDGDSVVDIDASEHNLVQALEDNGNPYHVIKADVGHANPSERIQQYTELIRTKVQPMFMKTLIITMIKREIATDTHSLQQNSTDNALGQPIPN